MWEETPRRNAAAQFLELLEKLGEWNIRLKEGEVGDIVLYSEKVGEGNCGKASMVSSIAWKSSA